MEISTKEANGREKKIKKNSRAADHYNLCIGSVDKEDGFPTGPFEAGEVRRPPQELPQNRPRISGRPRRGRGLRFSAGN